jgi:uncharacterized protein (DUF1330 family)
MNIKISNVLAILLSTYLSTVSAMENATQQTITLGKGERLTVVLVQQKEDGASAQQQYVEGVFSLAKQNKIRELKAFPVLRTLSGENKPQAMAFYAWTSAQASQKVRYSEKYEIELSPLKSKGWNELSEADVDFPVKTEYKFDINKTYTLAEVWLKDSVAYDKYYKGTAALRKKMGAKIIFKLRPNEYNSLTKGPDSPDFLILIEWPNKQGPEHYAQSEEVKPYKPYIEAGLAKLGWYEVGFPASNAEVYK